VCACVYVCVCVICRTLSCAVYVQEGCGARCTVCK
jgi:hypothetical protein